jgi:hypothetical protein
MSTSEPSSMIDYAPVYAEGVAAALRCNISPTSIDDPEIIGRLVTNAVLKAAEPLIAAAERERLARLLDAEAGHCYDAASASTKGGLRPPVAGHVAAGGAYEHAAQIIREASS